MLELLLELAELLALALPFELALPDWAEASDVEASRSDKATATNRIIIYLHRSGTLLLMSFVPARFQEATRILLFDQATNSLDNRSQAVVSDPLGTLNVTPDRDRAPAQHVARGRQDRCDGRRQDRADRNVRGMESGQRYLR